MIKRLSLAITALVLFTLVMPVISHSSSAAEGLVSFVPILHVEVDTSALSQEIKPEGVSVNVPVTVKYRVDVPSFLKNMIGRIFVFGKFIVPPMKVHLSVINKPEWADITITSPDLYIDLEMNKFSSANTSLSITVYKDAPAQPYTLILRAESDAMGKVTSQSVDVQFKITPGFIPLITINTDEPIKEAGPMTTLTFPIKISNNANKEAIVKLTDYTIPPGWGVQPSQNQLIIPQGKEDTLFLSVTTPIGFGWMPNQIQQIKLKFVVMPSPPTLEYEETGSNVYIYSVSVKSGSTPLAGIVGAIVAIVVVIIVIVIMAHRKGMLFSAKEE